MIARSHHRAPATVIYDGDCGLCETSKRVVEQLDWAHRFEWSPLQSGVGDQWGIPLPNLIDSVHLVQQRRIDTGFRACQRILAQLPATYLTIGLALWAARSPGRRLAVAAGAVVFFTRLANPVGQIVYQWVARRRGGACQAGISPT